MTDPRREFVLGLTQRVGEVFRRWETEHGRVTAKEAGAVLASVIVAFPSPEVRRVALFMLERR